MVPHLDAAYNLARWLTRRADEADEVVQEAYLRASGILTASLAAMGACGLWQSSVIVASGLTVGEKARKCPLMSGRTEWNPANPPREMSY